MKTALTIEVPSDLPVNTQIEKRLYNISRINKMLSICHNSHDKGLLLQKKEQVDNVLLIALDLPKEEQTSLYNKLIEGYLLEPLKVDDNQQRILIGKTLS